MQINNTDMTGDAAFPINNAYRSLASCWVVGLDDVMDSSGLWLAGCICRWSIYQCVWDAVLSWWNQWLLLYLYNDDVTLFIHYDYIQLLAYVTMAKQVI